ncbi:MAG: PEP-CTERM sorting domain-containing protein [Phycisphaerae bacterium]
MLFNSHSRLLAACGGSAVVALGCVSFASAGVVYQDNFARTGSLIGTSPSPTDTGGASWTGNLHNVTATTDGSELVLSQASGQYAVGSTFLPFTPPTSGTVTLSAGMEVGAITGPSSAQGWGLIGFVPVGGTNGVANGSYNAGPTVQLVSTNGEVIMQPNTVLGSSAGYYMIPSFSHTTVYQFTINYNMSAQTAQWYIGAGSSQALIYSYNYATHSDAPTITTVETGIWASQKNTTPEVVDVQNFELTTTPVPEPANDVSVFPNPGLTNPRMQFNTGAVVNNQEQLSPYLPNIPGPLSGWVVTMWNRSEVLNANEMVTNDPSVSDPTFGSAAYSFTTPNQNAQLAIYRDTVNNQWVYNLFERNGTLTPGGGANLFLSANAVGGPFTMNHPIGYNAYAKISEASATYNNPQAMTNGAVLAQVFSGFILQDSNQGLTVFMQIMLADSRGGTGGNGGITYLSQSGNTYVVDIAPPGGNPLAFQTDNGPLHYLSYQLNPFFSEFLAAESFGSAASNPANWSLNSMYVGLETENSISGGAPQGSVSVGLQIAGLTVYSEPVPEPTTLGFLAIGSMGLALLKRRKYKLFSQAVNGGEEGQFKKNKKTLALVLDLCYTKTITR